MRQMPGLLDLIGNTPLVPLRHITRDLKRDILVKLEYLNPSGSIKDRIALFMIEAAEREGRLRKDSIVIEPTSGNTGIALALVCRLKGYRFRAVIPEAMSEERKCMIRCYGGEVVCTRCECKDAGVFGRSDVERTVDTALEMQDSEPRAYVPNQFTNPANIEAHRRTTGEEIWRQTGSKIDAFVAAAGTGGTVSGVGQALKSHRKDIRVCVVEPEGAAVLSGCEPCFHRIQGIGEGFIPECLDMSICDEIQVVSDDEAIDMARKLHAEEGIFGGISSGANVAAAMRVASTLSEGATVVTIVPDGASRYFSTGLFGTA